MTIYDSEIRLQAPGWLKRPVGASFGFGGQLVSFNKSSNPEAHRAVVHIRKPCTEPEFIERAEALDVAMTQGMLKEFCQKKVETADSPDEANEWQFMNILFDEDTRRRLTNFVGYSREDISSQVSARKRVLTLTYC